MTVVKYLRLPWSGILVNILMLSQVPRALAAAQRCFDHNGNQLSNALPCDPSSTRDGPCCTLGDICLSNGLCMPGPNVSNNGQVDTYRPSCTDGTWTVDTCFSGCNSFVGDGLQQCGDNRFCCYNATGCDCASTSLFELDAATFITTLPLSTNLPTSTSSPASASAITTSSAQSTLTSAADSSSAQSSSQSSSRNVAIGAGIGAGVGIPLLAAVGVLAWYLHRRQKSREVAMKHGGSYPIQELGSSTQARYRQMASGNELSAETRQELDTSNTQELDGSVRYRRDA